MIPLHCKPFVTAFRKLDIVVKSCFGSEIHPDYSDAILSSQQAYLDLGISITPKIHAIFYHVPTFCDAFEASLGRFSEQASEAVHYSFTTVWNRHKVLRDHPQYASYLLRAVSVYNCNHI